MTKAKIDLDALDVSQASEAGAEVKILHPTTGEELEIVIVVSGPDSKRSRDATRQMTDQLTKEAVEKKLTPDDKTFERMAAMHAAAITQGWSGIEWGGEPFAFTPENAIKLYTERRWIREQVERFAGQRGNFFRPSPMSSAA